MKSKVLKFISSLFVVGCHSVSKIGSSLKKKFGYSGSRSVRSYNDLNGFLMYLENHKHCKTHFRRSGQRS